MRSTSTLILLILMGSICPALGQSQYRPVIVLYTGGDTALAGMLADLIEEDPRIDSDVEIVTTAAAAAMSTVLPTTECLVIYCNHKDQIAGLEPGIGSFLAQGGGVVGINEVCYEPSAEEMALEVFPVGANTSVVQRSPAQKRVRHYLVEEGGEIASGLPEAFELLSMGIYLRGDEEGNYIEFDGGGKVVYRDGETGSPLVVTYESKKGGRSVAFTGVMVVKQDRVDVYYGKLIAQEDFVKLFTNCVFWAAKGSQRYQDTSTNLSEKIEGAETRYERAREEAEKARQARSSRKMVILAAVWVVGLVACGMVVKKVVLSPEG